MNDRQCSIDGCAKVHYGLGLCAMHYRRLKDRGTTDLTRQSAADRLDARIDRSAGPSGCWPWMGACNDQGYGQLGVDSSVKYVHRLVYETNFGPIPAGLVVDHECHNADQSCPGGASCLHRRCANPAHLVAATHGENIARGAAPSARSHRAGRCQRGHLFDESNTYITPDGKRQCRACKRLRWIPRAQRTSR